MVLFVSIHWSAAAVVVLAAADNGTYPYHQNEKHSADSRNHGHFGVVVAAPQVEFRKNPSIVLKFKKVNKLANQTCF